MTDLIIHPAEGPLSGSVPVPSDKSIGHRALLFGALCTGKSRVTEFSYSADNVSTLAALRAMGVRIDEVSKSEAHVHGVGLYGLRAPAAPLDCGNSGTTMRLLLGILAPQAFESQLVGDHSLSRRPMMRVVGPLRSRGARIDGQPHPKKEGDVTAPLVVHALPEKDYLGSIEYESPISSAQVKSAILLSGLFAHGTTYFKEPSLSRDHTERMLSALGVPLRTVGTVVELDPAGWNGEMPALDVAVPGDISAAAFLFVAGQVVSGSRITTRDVGINPTRTGILEILREMRAGIEVEPHGERAGDPIALVHAWPEPLRGCLIAGERVARGIDEIPIACVLAARAHGTTAIRDAAELRVKESDRIAKMAEVLRGFGITCEEKPDGLDIEGRPEGKVGHADVASDGDHRIAMSACILGLVGDAPSRIRDVDCITTSFPKFVATLRGLGARIEVAP